MELEFDTDQEDLRDNVRAFLTAECPIGLVREIVNAGFSGAPASAAELHEKMVGLGWPALTVPEHAGGLGLGPVELALVAEELGRSLAPGPLFATLTQYVPAIVELAGSEQAAALLAPIATGTHGGTLAIAEATGAIDPAATTLIATRGADGYLLHGTKSTVFEPDPAGSMVVVARFPGTIGDDGVSAFVLPVGATQADPIAAVDPSRILATVTFDDVAVGHDAVLGTPGPQTADALRRALHTSTLSLALDAVGAAQQLFDVTLEYVKHREQFDVPIGSFQAIKHKFADMLILLERARALGVFAALTIAEDDDRRSLAVAMAKAAAGDCAIRIAKEGIQLHGGIGYTWEADVHLYVRRLESDALLFGTAEHHRRTVADLIGV